MVLLIELDINTPKLPGYSKNVISTENRRYLKAATGITGDNLSRYIGRLRDKGLIVKGKADDEWMVNPCLLYTSPSPRDGLLSRMPSSA